MTSPPRSSKPVKASNGLGKTPDAGAVPAPGLNLPEAGQERPGAIVGGIERLDENFRRGGLACNLGDQLHHLAVGIVRQGQAEEVQGPDSCRERTE
jgi:hypothetical protein